MDSSAIDHVDSGDCYLGGYSLFDIAIPNDSRRPDRTKAGMERSTMTENVERFAPAGRNIYNRRF
jgi:hypothetical protein